MKCEDARAAMLSGSDIEPVRQHLATCRACRVEQPLLLKLRATLASSSLWEEPSPDVAERIMATVRDEEKRGEADKHIPSESRRSAKSRPPKWRTGLIARLALASLVVLAGALYANQTLGADWEMTLVSASQHPEASAVVQGWSTSRGTRMVVDIVGLDDAPSGSYYEIWMTAVDGRHISAGTFNGSGRVTAFAAVRRSDYPRIWITLETADQDLGPSRETYFDTA